MIKIATACLAAALLCTGCILTKEEIDCWYDDVCQNFSDAANTAAKPHAPRNVAPVHAGR